MKKTYLAVHSTVSRFVVNLLAYRKVVDSKYSLLAGDTNQASIFSPCIGYK